MNQNKNISVTKGNTLAYLKREEEKTLLSKGEGFAANFPEILDNTRFLWYPQRTIEAHCIKSTSEKGLAEAGKERDGCRSGLFRQKAFAGNRDKIPFAVAAMRSAIRLFKGNIL